MKTDFMPVLNRNPLMLIGAGLGLANSVGKWFTGNSQVKAGKKINPIFNQYKTSPFAQQQLGMAQQLFNGRMAGAGAEEQNIFNNQASAQANVNRNAGDASTALALAAGLQGQSNQAFGNLGMQEAQNKYSMLGNLNKAYGTLINEGDKEYDSMFQKYQMDLAQKNALLNAGMQNKSGAVGDLSSMGMQLGQLGMFGGGGMGKRAGGGALSGLFGG